MKLKFMIVFFLLFISTVACAQVDSKKENVQEKLYSFGGCKISVSLLKDSSFKIDQIEGIYYIPLNINQTDTLGFGKQTAVRLMCFSDARPGEIEEMTGGYIYNKKWAKNIKFVSDKLNDDAPLILLSHNNWDAIIRVFPPPVIPVEDVRPSLLEIYNQITYCLKETSGDQMLCDTYSVITVGDYEIKLLIDALKTISFVRTNHDDK